MCENRGVCSFFFFFKRSRRVGEESEILLPFHINVMQYVVTNHSGYPVPVSAKYEINIASRRAHLSWLLFLRRLWQSRVSLRGIGSAQRCGKPGKHVFRVYFCFVISPAKFVIKPCGSVRIESEWSAGKASRRLMKWRSFVVREHPPAQNSKSQGCREKQSLPVPRRFTCCNVTCVKKKNSFFFSLRSSYHRKYQSVWLVRARYDVKARVGLCVMLYRYNVRHT